MHLLLISTHINSLIHLSNTVFLFCRALLVPLVPEVLRVPVELMYVWLNENNVYRQNYRPCIYYTSYTSQQLDVIKHPLLRSSLSLFPAAGSTRPSRWSGPHGIRGREGKSENMAVGILPALRDVGHRD